MDLEFSLKLKQRITNEKYFIRHYFYITLLN